MLGAFWRVNTVTPRKEGIMNTHTRQIIATAEIVAAMLVLTASSTFAQVHPLFASKGVTEVGGSISFVSTTPVSNGSTGDALTTFSLQPFIGYFVADGFELGLNPLGITTTSFHGSSSTRITIFAAPSYNFRTAGVTFPFIEALLGYTSQSDGSTLSGFSWGGRAGVKLAVGGNALVNIGMQYLQITMNPNGATNRFGTNQLSITAGFTVWF